MFFGRLPDHSLQAGTVLDEAVSFDASVEDKEPLNTILAQLHTEKLDLTIALNSIPWVLGSAPHTPTISSC